MKQAILAVAIIGLLVRVYFVYHGAMTPSAKSSLPLPSSPQAVEQLRHNMQASAIEAGEAVPGRPTANKPAPAVAAANAPAGGAATPANAAERQEIEGALKAMHLTTIMPGQPGLIIVDKEEYSEGESLPLPKGRKARIVMVQDDGVQLVCNGMAFHLDAPTGPDLAALRKKK